MKPLWLLLALLLSPAIFAQSPADRARWAARATATTITRDDWGIAHIRGRTDADAVFGMTYAQCEDDFNRVETNYLVSLGRLAEAEGAISAGRVVPHAKVRDWLTKLANGEITEPPKP